MHKTTHVITNHANGLKAQQHIDIQHAMLLENHKNKDQLTQGDEIWLRGASVKRGLFFLLRQWLMSNEMLLKTIYLKHDKYKYRL